MPRTPLSPYLDYCSVTLENSALVPPAFLKSIRSGRLTRERAQQLVHFSGEQLQSAIACFDFPSKLPSQDAVGSVLRTTKTCFDLAAYSLETQSLASDAPSKRFLAIGQRRALFAAQGIELALIEAWAWAKRKNYLPSNAPNRPEGLFILGLGKLGGRDLNFSSDVDLIAFYDKEIFTVAPTAGRVEAAGKILARVGRTLSDPLLEKAHGQHAWRIDWRLRPDPGVNPLAISSSAALDYYFFHAEPWERLALAKAAMVAGDATCGKAFLRELNPFIWRRNLEFDTLDNIVSLKKTIHARHPGLSSDRERAWRDRGPTMADWQGYNFKLGVGGIREIEFITQALQMLWGGRDTSLRQTNCPLAIEALRAANRLRPEDAAALLAAYVLLRRSENALQAYQNQQTHTLPSDAAGQRFLCDSVGYQDHPISFIDALKSHTRRVAALFDALLVERESADASNDQTKSADSSINQRFLDTLTDRNQQLWRQLELGQIPAAQSVQGRAWLQKLLPWIAKTAKQSGSADQTLAKIHKFLSRQPLSAGYLETIARYPKVREALAQTFVSAPSIHTLVEQSPYMIDRLVAGDPGDLRGVFESQRQTARDDEIWLNRLRRIVNEELFATYTRVISGGLRPVEAEHRLTHLAEEAIRAQLRFVATNRKLDPDAVLANLSVIAMGKLGMGRMAPLSDLDLIFVNADNESIPNLPAFMSRFITGMTTKLREGIAYDIDLRLRPSGRSGPPAIPRRAFDAHHDKTAKTWEHLALSAGRVLRLSENEIAANALAAKQKAVLSRGRNAEQTRLDAARMLVRLRKHRIAQKNDTVKDAASQSPDLFNIKLQAGGLMEAEFLVATLTVLKSSSKTMDFLDQPHDDRLITLGIEQIAPALRFWRDAQWLSRLMGLNAQTPPAANQKELFCRLMGSSSIEAYAEQAIANAALVSHEIDRLLPEATYEENHSFWASYQETHVAWLDQVRAV